MTHFNLIKSLTRVINNSKGLLILCLSLATFGVNEVWGNTYTAKLTVSSANTAQGKVYVYDGSEKKSSASLQESSSGDRTFSLSVEPQAGYHFNEWTNKTNIKSISETQAVVTANKKDGTVEASATATFAANTDTKYTVKHYQQNVDGSYPANATETDNLTGTTDTKVTPNRKSYSGFTAPAGQELTIKGDGSASVSYNYTRNSYNLTWNLDGGSITTAGTAAGTVKYGATLTAPEVSKAGALFNGWSPEIPATMPAENVTYTAQWVSKYNIEVTGFSKNMNVGDTQENAFTFVHAENPTPHISVVSIDAINNGDGQVIEYDVANNEIIAHNAGTATIYFTQAETETMYESTSASFTYTVTKNDNTLYINGTANSLSKSLYVDQDWGVSLTATNTDYSGCPISVTPNNDVVTMNVAKTQVSSHSKLGTTTWTLSQPENYKYKAANATLMVNVVQQAEATCFVKDLGSQTLEQKLGKETDKFTWSDQNAAGTLSYQVVGQKVLGVGSVGNSVQAYQFVNGSWIKAGSSYDNYSNETYSYHEVPLDPTATGFYFTVSGSYASTIKDIRVTRKTYLNTTSSILLDKKANGEPIFLNDDPVTATLHVDYSMCNGGTLKLQSDNPKFSLSQTTITEATDGTAGSRDIIVSYHSDVAEIDEGKIYVYNDAFRAETTIKGITSGNRDEIVWKYKDGDHVWAGQNLNADGKLATANNEVWFDGDLNHLTVNNTTNPKMVYTEIASDDALVTISASTLGDDYYASVNSSIQVYIDRCYQGLNWDQSFVSYTASAEGQIDLTIPLTAVAVDSLNNSTNLPIVYSVDNTSIAEITGNAIDGWNLHIKGTGEATLTASVSPTNIYQGVSDTRKINVRREGEHCGSYVLISTGEKNINQINNDTYTFSRPGETLTFKTRKYVAITLNANVTVEGYNIKENAWQNIDKYKLDFTSKQTKTYTISEDFRKIRMYTDADIENNYRYISDLYITQKEYLRPSVQEINAEIYINQDFSQTFTVDYSDKPYINCTIDNDQLEILRDDDNNTCGEYGTISFTVRSKNKWLTPTSISGTITLNTTVGDNITIPVSVDVKLGGTYKFTNATGDGDWTNLNNWDYGGSVPTSLPQMMNQVEILQPMRVTTNVEVYELEVKQDITQGWNGSVTIAPTGGITVYNGGVTGIDNKLTIESSKEHTGYFRVVPSVVKGWHASPTATIEFATRSTLDTGADKDATWQYFGPAVDGVNFTADYNTWLYDWSEQKGWVNMRDGKSHSLQPFHGYVITQYGQPVYDFTGPLLMGDYDITLTKTPSGMNGSNIIVNSYPSPIDVTKFTEEDFDEGINKTFYLYNSGSWNQWQAGQDAETLANKQDNTPGTYYAIPVLSAKYLTDCQTIIPPMNGIYVTTTIDGAQMHLSYEKHVWPASATNMNLPLRAPMRRAVAEDENIEDNFDKPLDRISVDTTNYAKQLAHRVVLRVTSENSGSDRVTLLEHTNHEHFTSGYDNGYDARKMGTQGVVNVFTNEQSGMYAVSATNDIDNMYIGIVSGSDNAYQLSVSSVVGEDLYLKDLVADVEIPLIEGQTYWFNMTPNTENDNRFIILHRQTEPFIPTSSNEINSDAYIWISGNSLHIENAYADSYMQLYAADGKLLYTEKINRSAELQINHLPNSVYLVNVDGKQMKFVKQ